MAGPVLLEELTWPEIAAVVADGETLCLLPVGATEQHGRHLPTATDTTIATAICREASERTGVPVLTTLAISSSHAHTMRWPGTFSLPPRLALEVVGELARWVYGSGFTRLLIVNAHGGNVGMLRVAVEEIRLAGDLQVGVVHWFTITPDIQEAVERDCLDWHANAAETSLMLHLRPDLVRRDEIRDDADRTRDLVFSYTVDLTSSDGLTGAPSTATAEEGARLFDAIATALAARIVAARREEPPLERVPAPLRAEHL
jgi:creatinine amidohydrolase